VAKERMTFPMSDEAVVADNWREVQPGDYVWYVPESATSVDDVKLAVVPTQYKDMPVDILQVEVVQDAPTIHVPKGRIRLAEPRPSREGERA
jgi:hypothetical protein